MADTKFFSCPDPYLTEPLSIRAAILAAIMLWQKNHQPPIQLCQQIEWVDFSGHLQAKVVYHTHHTPDDTQG